MSCVFRMEVKQSKELIVELMRKIQRGSDTKPQNKGKGIDKVEERQKRRKVSQLKESCRSALWFSDSFNLDLLSIYFQVKNTDECISIDYQSSKQNNLSDKPVSTINQLLYILLFPMSYIMSFQWCSHHCRDHTLFVGSGNIFQKM